MNKHALRSRIQRNVRDGRYHGPIARAGHSEMVRALAGGGAAVVGAAPALSTNLGDVLARVFTTSTK